jgi:hypothetical protein
MTLTNISGTTNEDEKDDKAECRGSRAENHSFLDFM